MARLTMMLKAKRKPAFSTRYHNRCPLCGRARSYIRKFDMCRLCFRKMASNGLIPGIIKSSW
ncbi:MAG TPA: type Z 30S ribosomal protein S14 [bacterium]|nr:type Z 30S ribosomal protein S14 [bacterium]